MSAINFDAGTWTEWHPANKLPESETTVLVFSPKADEPVWLGYHDGELWCDDEGVPYMTPVVAWADIPHPEEMRNAKRGMRKVAAPATKSFMEEMTTPAFTITPSA